MELRQIPVPARRSRLRFHNTVLHSLNGGPQNRVDNQYNGYGLVTEKDEYDFGASSPAQKTTITYASLSNNILDHPSSVVVTDGSGNLKAKTTYGYDETAVASTSGTRSEERRVG